MKSIKIIFSLLFGFLMLDACDTERDCPDNPLDNGNQVKFQASIGALSTRASGTTWDAGDAIGIYALNNGGVIPSGLYNGNENIKYTTPGSGVFTAASTAITFPESGSLDFVSYYPFQQSISNYTYNINVANQTNSAAIDLLYSNDCTGKTKDDTDISLTFKHMLSMLVLNVAAGDGIDALDGLEASVSGLISDGNFSLANGAITTGSTVTAIKPTGSTSGKSAILAAILVPGQNLNTSKVTFTLHGQVFEWTPEDIALESGKKYTYSLQLSTSGIISLQPTATILDWEDAQTGTGTIVLTPEDGDILTVSAAAIELDAVAGDSKEVTVTASGAWTATTEGTGFAVNPMTGTGNATVTVTANAASGASGKIIFTLDGTTVTKEVAVSQKTQGGITGTNLFPGSDFNDWNTFIGSLNSYGLSTNGYASQSVDGGRNNTGALYLKGTPTKNDYTFTAVVPSNFSSAGKTKIVFYIKGTSAKSLSLNVYIGTGTTMGTDYKCFNLGSYTAEGTINYSDANSYAGTIDTGSSWLKVTLDLADLVMNSTAGQNLFALKVGKDALYNLLVDDITLE